MANKYDALLELEASVEALRISAFNHNSNHSVFDMCLALAGTDTREPEEILFPEFLEAFGRARRYNGATSKVARP
ncbi:MAG: hypothetical protein H6715_06325 [Myxococcales bacterium]|nr:hypothetical protein [Myxococcales bacterium]MCB9709191.1 hypothetical protein [Myxococcales bacterium]